MRTPALWRSISAAAMLAATVGAAAATAGTASSGTAVGHHKSVYAGPTKDIACDKGSLPEKTQGRAPAADYASGRAAKGYFCNAREIGHYGTSGGYRVERYVDAAGHECAFYDSTLLFPTNTPDQGAQGQTTGTYVMDMTDPAHPVHTDTVRTPAFQTPHESVRLNTKRGLLVADMGSPAADPGFVDVFSVKQDCRHPVLDASLPLGILGHEGGFAPDGRTFYVASLYAHTLAAVDLSNPHVPTLLWMTADYSPHGVSISNDGNRLYMAEASYNDTDFHGLTILDVSQV
ncbi:MAG: hypothetical protein JO222_03595, partial [Frankiales bacterium]|nr:hypothetical protein [Frankiales bacterium]